MNANISIGKLDELGMELGRAERAVSDCEARVAKLEAELATAKVAAFDAFVSGAKWWENRVSGSTMWQSDQRMAESEALKRFPFTPMPERELVREAQLETERVRAERDLYRKRAEALLSVAQRAQALTALPYYITSWTGDVVVQREAYNELSVALKLLQEHSAAE